MALIIFSDERTHRPARIAIAGCVVAAVLLNLYDIFHPLSFSHDIGRAAGLYVNANVSGMAIVLGMILSVGIVTGKKRDGFVVLTGIGVAVTQSRSAALVYLIAVLFLFASRQVSVGRVLGLLLLGLSIAAAVLWLTGRLQGLADVITSGEILQITRLTSASGSETQGDFYSTQSRLQVAEHAWDIFSRDPVRGGGLGSAGYTHNMYLMHAADQGILGLFLFPAFALSAVWGARHDSRRMAAVIAITLLIWGFFSHNVLDEMHTLLCAALAASVARASRDESASPSTALTPASA
jgi:O-antigen ligase